MQASTVKQSTIGLLGDPRMLLSPEAAHQGTSVSALRRQPILKVWMLVRVVKLSERVDATRRLVSQDEYMECVEAIMDAVPTLRIEEVELVFRNIERGQVDLFGRLKIPDIVGQLIKYDGTTATEMRERANERRPDNHERMSERRPDFVFLTEQDLLDLGQIKKKETAQRTDKSD